MSDDERIAKIIAKIVELLTRDGGDLIAGRTFYEAVVEEPTRQMVENGWNVEDVTVYRHRLEWITHVPAAPAVQGGEPQ